MSRTEQEHPSRNALVDQILDAALEEVAGKYDVEVNCSIRENPDHTSTLAVLVKDSKGNWVETGWITGYGTGGTHPENLKYHCDFFHPLKWEKVGHREKYRLWLSWNKGHRTTDPDTFTIQLNDSDSSDHQRGFFVGPDELAQANVVQALALSLIYPAVRHREEVKKEVALAVIHLL